VLAREPLILGGHRPWMGVEA